MATPSSRNKPTAKRAPDRAQLIERYVHLNALETLILTLMGNGRDDHEAPLRPLAGVSCDDVHVSDLPRLLVELWPDDEGSRSVAGEEHQLVRERSSALAETMLLSVRASVARASLESLGSDELLRELDAVFAEINRRAENYLTLAQGCRDALDEGLVFATKAEKVTSDRLYSSYEPCGLRRLLDKLRAAATETTLALSPGR